MRELDSRRSDGTEIRLLWDTNDGRVLVAVDDAQTHEAFLLPVADGQRALDVFHYPYAYAARREPPLSDEFGDGGPFDLVTRRPPSQGGER